MDINSIKVMLNTKDYDFLKTNKHLGPNLILIGTGGSIAYGTNNQNSDIDIRGCAINTKEEILTGNQFEQVVDNTTDTTIYSFNKLIKLLSNCNPNTIEILGLKDDHYLYLSDIGKELLANKHLFLSKRAYYSFGGYSYSQLRRLDNKAMRELDQSGQEKHILNSIINFTNSFSTDRKYSPMPEDSLKLYIDKSENEELESEIFMDINLTHYPLRDYKGMWSEMNNIVKEYGKLGHRNKNAINKDKLAKHSCHLIRLYMMCHDILINGEIITYRDKDHDLLMDIRNGKYLDDNKQPTKEFMEMVEYYQVLIEDDMKKTKLPDKVDMKKINAFVASVNERIVKGEI